MRCVIQRVSSASVEVEGKIVGKIDSGLLVLLGITASDTRKEIDWMAEKIATLRIFPDDEGKMNRSLVDREGSLLVVSQFTLYGDCQKGRRPSFIQAAPGEVAEPLYEQFLDACRLLGIHTQAGIFGASMKVLLVNEGPVTLILES